jgi:hypothetical protein
VYVVAVVVVVGEEEEEEERMVCSSIRYAYLVFVLEGK